MTLFTSLYTGVNGMNAQSKATGTISTNIANMTTVGYKKSDTVFHDLVVNNTRPSRFANGGVLSSQVQRIDRQGALQQRTSSTEMGIVGDGFFTVKANDDPNLEYLYTRNGTFTPDAEGVMRNAAGFILYGWPVDLNGNVMSSPTTSGLVPVDVNEFDSEFRATTSGTLAFNLNGSQEAANPQFMVGGALPVSQQSTWDPILETSTDNSTKAHFVRGLTVYDNLGNPRELSFEYRKITGPMSQVTSQTVGLTHTTRLDDFAFFGNTHPGDMFTINVGAATQQYIVGAPISAPGQVRVDTVGELTNHLNSVFGGGTTVDSLIDGEGRLVIKATDLTANMSFTNDGNDGTTPLSPGVPLGDGLVTGGTFNLGTQAGNPPLQYTPYADVTVSDPLINPNQGDFPPIGNTANPNTNGWWEVRVLKPADQSNPVYIEVPAGSGNFIPNPDPLAGQRIEISKGLINFDGAGRLNTPRDAQGNVIDGTLTLSSGGFDSNPLVTGEEITVNIDMSRFEQFAGGYNVIIANQNGFEAGTLTGVEISREGMVVASFTNGQSQLIYQIPLATFVNPNGLQAMTGTVFAQTQEAGELTMLDAGGPGGAGVIEASTIETSNVDLADEFANLIVSQRAFSANSRVVNTVDEMTQQLRQLKS